LAFEVRADESAFDQEKNPRDADDLVYHCPRAHNTVGSENSHRLAKAGLVPSESE
jgi:hypothetical protein